MRIGSANVEKERGIAGVLDKRLAMVSHFDRASRISGNHLFELINRFWRHVVLAAACGSIAGFAQVNRQADDVRITVEFVEIVRVSILTVGVVM